MIESYVHRYGGRFLRNRSLRNHYRYIAGIGPILLDDVHCIGTEASIADCRHRGWGRHNCVHREDVHISCHTAASGLQFIILSPSTEGVGGIKRFALNCLIFEFYVYFLIILIAINDSVVFSSVLQCITTIVFFKQQHKINAVVIK